MTRTKRRYSQSGAKTYHRRKSARSTTVNAQQGKQKIPGYNFGTAEVAKSPIKWRNGKNCRNQRSLPKRHVFYLRLSKKSETK